MKRLDFGIIDYAVGDTVRLTPASMKVIEDGSRSIKVHPCWSFVQKIRQYVGQTAKVTYRYQPGYKMCIEFADGQAFQAKDSWVEPVELAELIKRWQPIETAPQDGTNILLRSPKHAPSIPFWWCNRTRRWECAVFAPMRVLEACWDPRAEKPTEWREV